MVSGPRSRPRDRPLHDGCDHRRDRRTLHRHPARHPRLLRKITMARRSARRRHRLAHGFHYHRRGWSPLAPALVAILPPAEAEHVHHRRRTRAARKKAPPRIPAPAILPTKRRGAGNACSPAASSGFCCSDVLSPPPFGIFISSGFRSISTPNVVSRRSS